MTPTRKRAEAFTVKDVLDLLGPGAKVVTVGEPSAQPSRDCVEAVIKKAEAVTAFHGPMKGTLQ